MSSGPAFTEAEITILRAEWVKPCTIDSICDLLPERTMASLMHKAGHLKLGRKVPVSAADWTGERVEKLKALWLEGLSASQIGKALGISKNAALGKIHRLGLSNRERPSHPSRMFALPGHAKKPRKPWAETNQGVAAIAARSAPKPKPTPISAESLNPVDIMGLTHSSCRAIIEDDLYCGNLKDKGSYCLHHSRLYYIPEQPRRRADRHTAFIANNS